MALIETTTAEGALKGMVTARAPHELRDQEVAYLQDAIINQPGFVNRRGAFINAIAIADSNVDSSRIAAACTVTDPAGITKIGLIYLKNTGAKYQYWIAVFDSGFSFIQKHLLWDPGASGALLSYPSRIGMVQCVPAMDGSVIISIRHLYWRAVVDVNSSRVIRWYGGCPLTSQGAGATTATLVSTEGSTAVTGAVGEIAKVSFPGTIITSLGVVAKVTSTTQVDLQYPATVTFGASSFGYYMAEAMSSCIARGKISCSAGVLSGVVGYGTKFTERNDIGTGTPSSGFMYLDGASLKSLAHLTSNVQAAVSDSLSGIPTSVPRSASMKSYFCYSSYQAGDHGFNRFEDSRVQSLTTPLAVKGSFWTAYKGYLISFNGLIEQTAFAGSTNNGDQNTTSRAYIHGPRFPDVMDKTAADGDWFNVDSTKPGDPDGIAIGSGANSVILCKAQETFALRGDDIDNFTYEKIADDGALTFESITAWRGAPIWLGRTGIWMYDGVNDPVNIVENTLGSKWKTFTESFDGTSVALAPDGASMLNMAKCFVYKDYLFVNLTNTGNQHVIYTDGVARTSNQMQLMIYLPTMAVSFISNFNWSTTITVLNRLYAVIPEEGSVHNYLLRVDDILSPGSNTTDNVLTLGSYNSGTFATSVGPWFHMESRKYDLGDGLRRKTWKQLSVESNLTNARRMFLETVAGLNTTGVRAATPYTGSGLWQAAKIRFNNRGQYMSFRLYEDISNRPRILILGAWQWGYKLARRGQV